MTGIAIVGMACLYPDANSPAQLWENVLARRRAFRRMPPERLRLADYFSPDKNAADRMYATEAALITDYEFDRLQFRVGRSTFQSTDLTHWLALDVAARALADAGFPEGANLPRESTGVLVGNTLTGEFSRASVMRLRWPYVRRVVGERLAAQGWAPELRERFLHDLEGRYKAPFAPVTEETLAGGLSNTIAGRICNHFDLGGGGFTVDGACSSSLLAVAKACSALVAGDLDAAVVGGVDLSLDPFELVGFAKTGALAPGEMRVFDARSAGFWPGEGCGFVVLLREEDARARGLRAYAVIRGWGISSDGSGGLTRPESAGQLLALRRAYTRAGFEAASVPLFEGHGTGTKVGDEVELRTLAATRQGGEAVPAVVGSVKGNIGHTKAAAGVAGLIKATLALHHRVLPPAAGVETPHPVLTESGGMLRVLFRGEAWPAELPVRAGVSAMGFGGINVHVALEGEPASASRLGAVGFPVGGAAQDAELVLLGGQDVPDLLRQVEQLAETATWAARAELTDLACTMARSLQARQVRAAVVAASPAELRARLDLLRQWLEQGETDRLDIQAGVFLGSRTTAPRIAYLFAGQGAPVHTEAGAVGQQFPEAQAVYDMVPLPGDRSDTALAQPAIVAASVAGLRVLRALGLEAGLAIGHSLGELTALHWAGALDEQAVLDLALARGAIMADAAGPAGAMASIGAGPAALDELLSGTTAVIACYNAPGQTVVAGEVSAVEKVMARARARGLNVARLPVSHAFHSPLVQGAATALSAPLARVAFGPVGRPVISTVTAAPVEPGVDLRALLERQVADPVRFVEAMEAAAGRADLFIEVGPGRMLSTLAGEIGTVPAVPLEAGSASFAGLLRVAGAAFAAGAPVQVEALFAGRFHRPFYPARRPRFFVNPCELAPEGDAPVEPTADAEGPSPAADEATQTAEAYGDVLALVRRLVAEWTDLPVDAIADDARLLQDLHLNSLSVGQLVARAARQLGLGPSAAPTEYAGATVAGLAQALFDLRRTGGGASSPDVARLAPGVDAWVRPFAVDLVERPLPRRRTLAGEATGWEVLASPGHPLQQALTEAFRELEGGGVVLCLPPEPDERHVPLLLAGARALLQREKPDRFVLVQHGGGGSAFARTVHLELPGVATTVVDVPVNHPQAVSWVAAEVSAATGYTEVHYDSQGARRQPFLRLLSDEPGAQALPLTADDVLLVTGGGKGIGAECALAAARRTGARLVLLGRARPESDRELTANLERLTAAGVAFRYTVADVTDSEAVARAMQEAEEHFGPVTAVLHAAGTNAPEPLQSLSEAAFQRTVAIKVGGLRHVLAAVDPTRLRLLVTFGSVIARTGMRGEADYAVANEWLVRLTEQWQAGNPHCRCIALEWSVWSGVGMGERLGRVDALAREGITPIMPDQGVALFEALIARPVPAVAVVITGRLGDVPTVRWEPRELPLLRFLERPRAHYPGVELVADAELSPATDPYLAEHVVEGQSLFPAVMGLEAMTQAAMALAGRPELPVLESVQFAHPIVVPDGAGVTVRVAAGVRAPGLIEVVLRSSETGFGLDHFRAVARFQTPDHMPEAGMHPKLNPDPVERPSLAPDALYGSLLFQTGRFRRLLGYRRLLATACTAEISRGAPEGWFGPYLPAELRLGDPGARDACLHAVQACVPDATLLPVAVQKLVITRTDAGPCLLHAVERHQEGETFTYDLTVQSPSGQVLERWEGLTFRRVKTGLANHNWAPALLGTHAQRHLHQLVPGWPVTVAVEQGQPGEERQARSDRAIQRALGRAAVIRRRPDGRPEADGAPPVSAAHAGALTLAIAGPGLLGCDMERVTERTEAAWHDLLGPERLGLAQLVTARSGDDKDTAATRVWAVTESLKKAGAPYHTPLLLAEALGSGWVTFAAGRFRAATWVATLQDGTQLVLAFAKGDADALV